MNTMIKLYTFVVKRCEIDSPSLIIIDLQEMKTVTQRT